MALDLNQIIEEIKRPSKAKTIRHAVEQQNRIKFHADTNLDIVKNVPFAKFDAFVKSLLPTDKYLITMNLLKFPIPTNEVTEAVFVRLSKIFDGRNPANNYQFHRTQERDDWEYYRQEVLHEPSVWANKAWEYFKTEINCVMVVDMPLVPNPDDSRPQPYFYFVPIESVISYESKDDSMKWIIYHSGPNVIAIDEENYWVFTWDKRKNNIGELIAKNPHELGFCPSRFFWTEPLSLAEPDIKKSPLSKELSNLDYYLFRELSKRYLDLYGAYPILSGYEEECDYSDKDGNVCSHGHLMKPDGSLLTDLNGNVVECPLCHGKKELAGAGSYISIPIPEEGQPDLRNPVQMLTADHKSLNYNVEDLARLKQRIISSCVGVDNDILNKVSLADKQVDASFESQETVLNRIKKGFESAQLFVDTTCCLLRYRDEFISASINYGTEFYTLTPEVLQARYNKAKEGGATDYELDALKQQIIETEYRHNPLQLQRMIILSDLEPYRNMTKAEVMSMKEKGLVTDEEIILKNDFSGFIRRFERENDNVLEFGTEVPYQDKINTIYQTLLDYAKQRKSQIPS